MSGNLTLKYTDEPVGARDATTPSCDDLQAFCNLKDILKDGNTAPQYATFEVDYWRLDKGFRLFPDNPIGKTWGLFSASMSNEDGSFTKPITLLLVLDGLFSSVGMTIEFDKYGPTWCCDMQINWWRNGAIISTEEYAPDGWRYTCFNEIKGFDMVSFVFRKMSTGWRYLKIQAITYGFSREFGSDELFNVNLFQDTDLISDTVSVNTLDFVLRNKSAIAFMFQRKQPMFLREDQNLIGLFYITGSEKTNVNKYEIHAVDQVGLIEMGENHKGGIYHGVRSSEIVSSIMGNIPWKIEASLQNKLLYGHLPIASRRDNLQQVAFALGAMVCTARRDYVEIVCSSSELVQSEFSNERCYENGKLSSESVVTAVNVTSHKYTKAEERSTLFDGFLEGNTTLEFSEPMGDLQILGGTIVQANANYAIISGTGSKTVFSGCQYKHTKSVHTMKNPMRSSNDADNPVSYSDMTLVSSFNITEVLTACYNHSLRLATVKGKVLMGGERPGDYVTINTEGDGIKRGHLVSADYVMSSKIAADVTVLAEYEGDVL